MLFLEAPRAVEVERRPVGTTLKRWMKGDGEVVLSSQK